MRDLFSVPNMKEWPDDPKKLERFTFEHGHKVVKHEEKHIDFATLRKIIYFAVVFGLGVLAAKIPDITQSLDAAQRAQRQEALEDIKEYRNDRVISEADREAAEIDYENRTKTN